LKSHNKEGKRHKNYISDIRKEVKDIDSRFEKLQREVGKIKRNNE